MLYKPTNPSPYNSVIGADEELTFSVSCISTSDVKKIRLAIKDDTYDYYFPIGESVTASCKSSSGSSISIPIGISSTEESDETTTSQLQFEKGYQIKSSGSYTRTDIAAGTLSSIRDKLSNLKQYRWQLRLYQADDENSATMNIGYGFVQDVYTYNDSSSTNALKRRKILKVRPHTNIFMSDNKALKNGKNIFVDSTDDEKTHIRNGDLEKNKALAEYYDDSASYYTQINGKRYLVKDYYYSKTNAYYKNSTDGYVKLSAEKKYEEPLFAFIEIDLKTGDAEIEEGAEYTILTNYIDSNEYYFSCRELGRLTFTDEHDLIQKKDEYGNVVKDEEGNIVYVPSGNPINFVSIDELDKNPDDHIYSPTHSNVQIKGSFDGKRP